MTKQESWTIVEHFEGTTSPWARIFPSLEAAIEAANKELEETWKDDPDVDAPTISTTHKGDESWEHLDDNRRMVVYNDTEQLSTYHFVQHSE